jgi:hypothetical protein
VIALCVATSAAWGFNSASQFYDLPGVPHVASTSASAEGIYFTGAPRFAGQTCSACHTDGPQQITIALGADPADLFATGYEPGRTYELEVQLKDESLGTEYATPTCTEPLAPSDKYAYVPCNNNNFALEIDTTDWPLASGFCAAAPVAGACPMPSPSSDEVVVAPGGDAVFGNQPRSTVAGMQKTLTANGRVSWHLWWTAPAAGTGPLTLYVGAVDGNGGDGTTTNDQDPYGDDTVAASIMLQEAGDPLAIGATAGCALAGRAPGPGGAGAWLLFAMFLVTARRGMKSRSQVPGRVASITCSGKAGIVL